MSDHMECGGKHERDVCEGPPAERPPAEPELHLPPTRQEWADIQAKLRECEQALVRISKLSRFRGNPVASLQVIEREAESALKSLRDGK